MRTEHAFSVAPMMGECTDVCAYIFIYVNVLFYLLIFEPLTPPPPTHTHIQTIPTVTSSISFGFYLDELFSTQKWSQQQLSQTALTRTDFLV
jgi:hypothetical protein